MELLNSFVAGEHCHPFSLHLVCRNSEPLGNKSPFCFQFWKSFDKGKDLLLVSHLLFRVRHKHKTCSWSRKKRLFFFFFEKQPNKPLLTEEFCSKNLAPLWVMKNAINPVSLSYQTIPKWPPGRQEHLRTSPCQSTWATRDTSFL